MNESSFIGIPKILNNQLSKNVRLIWVFLFVVTTFSAVWFLIDQTNLFLQYNVLTFINENRDSKTEFPVVTLCTLNFFNTPAGKDYLNDLETEFRNTNAFKKEKRMLSKSKVKLIQLRLKYAKNALYKNKTLFNNSSLIKSFGWQLKDMMLSCYFGSEPCDSSIFEYFFDINFGNCYRFNSGLNSSYPNQSLPIKLAFNSGDSSGLQLDLYVGQEDSNNTNTYSSGIHLAIHNKSFIGFLSNNGFKIPTGRDTNIGNILMISIMTLFLF